MAKGPARFVAAAPLGFSGVAAGQTEVANTSGTPRPVLVWIHGGGFIAGSASSLEFDPVDLALTGITGRVLFKIQYRLGPG